jgi:hypothetical protein
MYSPILVFYSTNISFIYVSKAGAYPSGAVSGGPANITLSLKGLTNDLAYTYPTSITPTSIKPSWKGL